MGVQCEAWSGAYDGSWHGLIVPDAFAHPAKFSRALIFRIVAHCLQAGMLQPGDVCLDPFGGVGLGGLPCALQGVGYIGIELEEKFCTLAQANIALWQQRYGHLPQWVTPQLVQGDSRRLAALIEGATGVVSSPPSPLPMSQDHNGTRGGQRGTTPSDHGALVKDGSTPGQLEGMPPGSLDAALGSPPYHDALTHGGQVHKPGFLQPAHNLGHRASTGGGGYHSTDPANLGNLPPGLLDVVVGSPPYADGCVHTGGVDPQPQHIQGGELRYVAYGSTPGQLADGAVGSPPWEKQLGAHAHDVEHYQSIRAYRRAQGHSDGPQFWSAAGQGYGTTPDNLGNTEGTTFWDASRTILEQLYLVLKPGAWVVWVTKDYVRSGKIVPFTEQWTTLNEACGFTLRHWHKALLVEEHGEQGALFGAPETMRTERKSFFRRLSEKKGSPRIDYESVLCFQKVVPAVPLAPDAQSQQCELVFGSPPYATCLQPGRCGIDKSKGVDPRAPDSRHVHHLHWLAGGYGRSPANLGAMRAGTPPEGTP